MWEDDDGMLQVELSASNGTMTTTQDFYVYPESLVKFGGELEGYFPRSGGGEITFEYGAEDEKVHSHVKLTSFYMSPGTIGVYVRTHNNRQGREVAVCEFRITTTLQAVNDLGKKIISWVNSSEKTMRFELGRA